MKTELKVENNVRAFNTKEIEVITKIRKHTEYKETFEDFLSALVIKDFEQVSKSLEERMYKNSRWSLVAEFADKETDDTLEMAEEYLRSLVVEQTLNGTERQLEWYIKENFTNYINEEYKVFLKTATRYYDELNWAPPTLTLALLKNLDEMTNLGETFDNLNEKLEKIHTPSTKYETILKNTFPLFTFENKLKVIKPLRNATSTVGIYDTESGLVRDTNVRLLLAFYAELEDIEV